MQPKLRGVDHIHLYVTNKEQALAWYQKYLGFEVVEPLRFWDGKNGPLVIEDKSKSVHLALFERQEFEPLTSVAFGSSGEDFIKWKKYFESQGIKLRVADHTVSWSLYFNDPFGHNHEITTNDYQLVTNVLN